jgi:hypothetical protein
MRPSLKTLAIVAILTSAAGALGACGTASNALGFNKSSPDEFRVVAKAPLVVPPDYALRPPAPGEPRPQELQPESSARQALLGIREAASRSQGETLLANRAGAAKADPLIRYVMDDEFGAVAHKDKSFADKVMFWKKSQPASTTVVATTEVSAAAPLDPVAEQAKIKSLTGDQEVVIARAPTNAKFKLPGL